jgi:hypothetical protein
MPLSTKPGAQSKNYFYMMDGQADTTALQGEAEACLAGGSGHNLLHDAGLSFRNSSVDAPWSGPEPKSCGKADTLDGAQCTDGFTGGGQWDTCYAYCGKADTVDQHGKVVSGGCNTSHVPAEVATAGGGSSDMTAQGVYGALDGSKRDDLAQYCSKVEVVSGGAEQLGLFPTKDGKPTDGYDSTGCFDDGSVQLDPTDLHAYDTCDGIWCVAKPDEACDLSKPGCVAVPNYNTSFTNQLRNKLGESPTLPPVVNDIWARGPWGRGTQGPYGRNGSPDPNVHYRLAPSPNTAWVERRPLGAGIVSGGLPYAN